MRTCNASVRVSALPSYVLRLATPLTDGAAKILGQRCAMPRKERGHLGGKCALCRAYYKERHRRLD